MPLQDANFSVAYDVRINPFMNTDQCTLYKTSWFLHFKLEHLSFGLSYFNVHYEWVLINAYMGIK